MSEEESAGPLAGVRVLDLSTVIAGPMAAMLLGDFGATVIKVEHPNGDPLRGNGPGKDGHGLLWKLLGRNKQAVTLNLSKPEGQELLIQLAARADVLIENFRPGVMERWNLGYDRLSAANPRLVMVRVTGFGQFGPYSDRAGFGTLAEAMSGFAHITGLPEGPPTLPPFGLADAVAAISAAYGAMLALYHRDCRGGRGQVIDLAIIEPILTVLGAQPTIFDQLGIVQNRFGNRTVNNSPRNTYRAADGRWLAVSTSTTSIAERVLRGVGHPEVVDQPWFATGRGRASHGDIEAEAAGLAEYRERDDLLRESDFVSLHLRLDETTRGSFGARELALMKPTAYLINTARGEVLDEPALIEALTTGRIAGAGLDVMEQEPLPAGHALTGLSNLLLLPHLGSITAETRDGVYAMSVANLLAVLAGRMPAAILNPEVLSRT